MNFGPRNGLHFLHIDTQYGSNRFITPLAQGIDAFHRNLTPPTWRAAQINHTCAWDQKADFFVQFQNLKRRAATVSLGLGAFDIRVIQLTLQPFHLGHRTSTRGFDLDLQITLTASR